jgi:hypothetical protein
LSVRVSQENPYCPSRAFIQNGRAQGGIDFCLIDSLPVLVWVANLAWIEDGRAGVFLEGARVKGGYALIRIHKADQKRNNWRLIKLRDEYAH